MLKKGLFIKTFGCLQNNADSERIKFYYWQKGFFLSSRWEKADVVIINTCMIRESAENRAYGLINKIDIYNSKHKKKIQIIVTGCMVGAIVNQKNIKTWRQKFPSVSEWLPMSTFDYSKNEPIRDKSTAAIIPISNGCNNFCSYCIVPFTRGKEISRPIEEILGETRKALAEGFDEVILVGQNVNSYGADFNQADNWVNMGKKRLRSLFPKLLEQVARMGFKRVGFVSSNPWDFSDELVEVISRNPNVDRTIHLPLQSGDDGVLKRMNRGYTGQQYLKLVSKIRKHITNVLITTDIIVGFPGEDESAFSNTVAVCKKVGFHKAYINKYSPRSGTISAKSYKNDIPQSEKKRRWMVLERLINSKPREDTY